MWKIILISFVIVIIIFVFNNAEKIFNITLKKFKHKKKPQKVTEEIIEKNSDKKEELKNFENISFEKKNLKTGKQLESVELNEAPIQYVEQPFSEARSKLQKQQYLRERLLRENKSSYRKSIKEQIQDLSPEMKAIVFGRVLDRYEDKKDD